MKTIFVDALHSFYIKDRGINHAMYELLESYPNTKIILTNANEEQIQSLGMVDLPYLLFTLNQHPKKSDGVDYYEQCLDYFGFSASTVVYFDHNPKAVENAQKVGITAYHYDKDAADLIALKAFLDAHL